MPLSLSHTLGKPVAFTFGKQEYTIEPLDLNDVADIEDHIGDIALLNPVNSKHLRLLLWMVFRKNDDRLTAADREECRYKVSLAQSGKRIPASSLLDGTAYQMAIKLAQVSGLIEEKADETESPIVEESLLSGPEGNAPAPESVPASASGAQTSLIS